MRRILAGTVALFTLWSMSVPVSARPAGDSQAVRPVLVDRDGDHISDGLMADLRNRGPNERVDVVVTWTRRPDIGAARRAAGPFDIKARFAVIDGFAASLTARQIHALSHVAGVFRVEQDYRVSTMNDEANVDFGTSRARGDFGVNGVGVVFCVVDTGVDATHEQLNAGKVVAWQDVINSRANPYDDQGHGTHVASILGGDGVGGPNASRYQGVAPGVSIAAVKVLDSSGSGTESQVLQGIDWCISQGVDGISMSLGDPSFTDGNDALSQAVDRAFLDHGILSVVAAGNSGDGPGTVGAPGAARQAITVGAAAKVADGLRLAGFSSRGPTADGRLKPDVVAPGVAITAASANTGSGYVAYSGTSMATPFTAGVVALMLDCNATLTPNLIKSMLGSTATDLGPAGADNNWGSGLIDGYGAVASACGGSGGMTFPTHQHVEGTVPNNNTYTYPFTIGADGAGKPISATILIQGQPICSLGVPTFCFAWEWSPDLDARLVGPNGSVASECPAAGECGTVGQTEVLAAIASQAGEYRIEIYGWTGSPNNGLGGGFVMDLFYGPAGTPPPPANNPPVANAGPDQTVTDTDGNGSQPVTLNGTGSSDPDGNALTYSWAEGGTVLGTTVSPIVSLGVGPHTMTLTVSDGSATASDAVSITVLAQPPPNTIHVGDLDATATWNNSRKTKWTAGVTVTVHNASDSAVSGVAVSFSLSDGTTRSCTTGTNGTCTVSKAKASNVGSLTFTVTNLTKSGSSYAPESNHDPDGDSNDTAIVVIKPL